MKGKLVEMNETENSMGTMNIPKLLVKISVPMMLSLLINSMYGVVDSIFVSRIGEEALTALSLASPIQILIVALGSGIAVGLNSVLSKALGERNREAVERTASAAMWLAVMAYFLIAVSCLLFLRPYFIWQSGGNMRIAEYGERYLRICMLLSFGQMIQWVFDRLLIAAGKSSLFLVSLTVASVINLILDPVFIFGYFGLPAMDTAGAGLATVIGQIAGGIAGILINQGYNREIPIRVRLIPDFSYCGKILKTGIPTALMQGLVSVMGVFINTVLITFSATAVAVFGICNRIQNFVLIGVNGINIGLIPIVAYNYGAKQTDRVKQAVRWALFYSLAVMAFFTAVLELFPGQFFLLFDASDDLLLAGIPALRILVVSYLASTVSTIISAYFQALGRAGYSLALTLVRQVLLVAVFIRIFASAGSLTFVWYAYIAAEVITIPLAAFLYKRTDSRIGSITV